MQKNNFIIKKSEEFVTNLFDVNLPKWAVYHNLRHTIDTVEGCKKIAAGSGSSNIDIEILTVASWFHDIGYIKSPEKHEEVSAEFAKTFLTKNQYSSQKVTSVINCIMATKLNHNPNNSLEAIISDADLISLGQKNYNELNNLLKLEIELREKRQIKEVVWLKRSLKFLLSHKYNSRYAQEKFKNQLDENIVDLRNQIRQL